MPVELDPIVNFKAEGEKKARLGMLISSKLKALSSFCDDVLPEYILVMIQNKKNRMQVQSDLEAFLGPDSSRTFSIWLWEILLQFVNGTLELPELSGNWDSMKETDYYLSDEAVEDEEEEYYGVNVINNAEENNFSDEMKSEEVSTVSNNGSSKNDQLPQLASVLSLPVTHVNERKAGKSTQQRSKRWTRAGYFEHDDRCESSIERPEGSASSSEKQERGGEGLGEKRWKRRYPASGAARIILHAAKAAADSTAGRNEERELKGKEDQPSRIELTSVDPSVDEKEVQFTIRMPIDRSKERRQVSADRSGQIRIECSGFTEEEHGHTPKRPKRSGLSAGSVSALGRCSFWPHCTRGNACPYIHPSDQFCKFFPNCSLGIQCRYIHPSPIPCKFGLSCTRSSCLFSHNVPLVSPLASSMGSIPCKFGNLCSKGPGICPYQHPTSSSVTVCKFGACCAYKKTTCKFLHPTELVSSGISTVSSSATSTATSIVDGGSITN